MSRLCLVLLLLCCALPARAQPPAPLDGEDLRLSLGAYAEYYRDAGGKARLGDILALPAQAFAALRGDHANFGKNAAAWWFRVRLDNRNGADLAGFPGGQLPAAGRPQGLPADRRWAHRTAGERRPVRLLPAPGAGAQLLVPAATAARREHPAAARAEQQHRLRAAVLQHLRGQRGQPGNPDGLQRGLLRGAVRVVLLQPVPLRLAARGHLRLVPAVQPQPRPVFRQLRRPAVQAAARTRGAGVGRHLPADVPELPGVDPVQPRLPLHPPRLPAPRPLPPRPAAGLRGPVGQRAAGGAARLERAWPASTSGARACATASTTSWPGARCCCRSWSPPPPRWASNCSACSAAAWSRSA